MTTWGCITCRFDAGHSATYATSDDVRGTMDLGGVMAVVEQTDNTTVLSLDQLRDVVVPYATGSGMRWARVFGSYARGEATGNAT